MESVADIDLTGIGWVAAGGMSGVLHKKHQMKMAWAAEVHDLCKKQNVPFLFKQSSNIHTERGINALSLFLAERAGHEVDPASVPLIRDYPTTELPLLPFSEHGKRFSAKDWLNYTNPEVAFQTTGSFVPRSASLPHVTSPTIPLSAVISSAKKGAQPSQTSRRPPAKDYREPERNFTQSATKLPRTARRKTLAVPETIADTVRAVLAKYPAAIAEWPAQRCSISEFPKGPEVSRRFENAKPAWIDAARKVRNDTGQVMVRKTTANREVKMETIDNSSNQRKAAA